MFDKHLQELQQAIIGQTTAFAARVADQFDGIRHGRRSTIITSQIPVDKWHALIGDPTYADAILDRIVHNAHRINLTGHSLRRSRASKTSKE